jgi:hypothetical protein
VQGLPYIAALLSQPGRAITAVDLAGLDPRSPRAGADRAAAGGDEYARLAQIRDQLEEAEAFHDRSAPPACAPSSNGELPSWPPPAGDGPAVRRRSAPGST